MNKDISIDQIKTYLINTSTIPHKVVFYFGIRYYPTYMYVSYKEVTVIGDEDVVQRAYYKKGPNGLGVPDWQVYVSVDESMPMPLHTCMLIP